MTNKDALPLQNSRVRYWLRELFFNGRRHAKHLEHERSDDMLARLEQEGVLSRPQYEPTLTAILRGEGAIPYEERDSNRRSSVWVRTERTRDFLLEHEIIVERKYTTLTPRTVKAK